MVNQPAYNPNDREQLAREDVSQPRGDGHLRARLEHEAVLRGGGPRLRASTSRSSIIDTSPGFMKVGATHRSRTSTAASAASISPRFSRRARTSAWRMLALSLEPEQMWNTLNQLGFGQVTTSGFPGESAGLLSHYSHWRPVGISTMSHGYGLSVTPLQLTHAYATLGALGVSRPSLSCESKARRPASAVHRRERQPRSHSPARIRGDGRGGTGHARRDSRLSRVGQDGHGVEGDGRRLLDGQVTWRCSAASRRRRIRGSRPSS